VFRSKKIRHKDYGSIQEYVRLQAKGIHIAIRKSDHPEIDTLEALDEEGIDKYQKMIGYLHWAVSLRTTLRYLDVLVIEKSYMFGDNQAVITSSSMPYSSLSKLAYHRVREMIAANIHGYYWVDAKNNLADFISKHWSYPQIWNLLKPLLFFSGNTQDLLDSKEDNTIIHHG
jgi:hypothetical protein